MLFSFVLPLITGLLEVSIVAKEFLFEFCKFVGVFAKADNGIVVATGIVADAVVTAEGIVTEVATVVVTPSAAEAFTVAVVPSHVSIIIVILLLSLAFSPAGVSVPLLSNIP